MLGVAIAVAWPWLELPDSLDPLLNETAGVGSVNDLPAALLQHALDALGSPAVDAQSAERLLVVLGFGVYLLVEARCVVRMPTPDSIARATARSVLIYVLLVSTSVQTWYCCLPIAAALKLGWSSHMGCWHCRRCTRTITCAAALPSGSIWCTYARRWCGLRSRRYAHVPGPINQPPSLSATTTTVPTGTDWPAQS